MATTVTLKPNAIDISGSTSGTTTLQATAVAGTTTLTLPAATDTLVGKATTDTLTNKTLTTPSVSSPTISDGTANGVAYLNGSKVLTTGSALVFDGSNLGVGNAPYVWLSSFRSLDVGSTASFAYFNSGSYVYNNAYYNTSSNLVYKTTGYAQSYIQNSTGQHVWQIAPSGTAGNAISFTQAMTLDASGRLGIGQTSPQYPLHITGASGVATYAHFTNATTGNTASDGFSIGVPNGASDAYIIQRESANLFFYTNALERAAIDASGNLLVGTTTSNGQLSIAGSSSFGSASSNSAYGIVVCAATNSSGSAVLFRHEKNSSSVGSITTTASATAYNTSSDYRLKNITGPLTNAKDFIMALKPKQGTWKVDGSKFVGFLAHEFQEVSPSSVTGDKDAVDADGKPIMQAMQASSAEVMANLVAHIQNLETRLAALEGA